MTVEHRSLTGASLHESSTTKKINMSSHGFSVGDVLRWSIESGESYVKALADSADHAQALGIVSAVTDGDNFTLLSAGYISGLSGLTEGAIHYVSADTAGALTTTSPLYPKAVLIATSTTTGYVFNAIGTTDTSGMDEQALIYDLIGFFD